jgi:hypothetical protein
MQPRHVDKQRREQAQQRRVGQLRKQRLVRIENVGRYRSPFQQEQNARAKRKTPTVSVEGFQV